MSKAKGKNVNQEQWEEGEVFEEEIQNDITCENGGCEMHESGAYSNESEIEYLQNLIESAQARLEAITYSEPMVEELSDYEMESLGGGQTPGMPNTLRYSTWTNTCRFPLSGFNGTILKRISVLSGRCSFHRSGNYLTVCATRGSGVKRLGIVKTDRYGKTYYNTAYVYFKRR